MANQFGTHFAPQLSSAYYQDEQWSSATLEAVDALQMHPASHVLHYASTCFEGLKAYRRKDGTVHIFRLEKHIARLLNSAAYLYLPTPSADLLRELIVSVVKTQKEHIPEFPGALYLRPTLIGLDPNIGNAGKPAHQAMLYVLASPVGNYFGGSEKTLRILVDDENMRTTPTFGQVKTGGNYAAALQHISRARIEHQCDQVLFCPDGDVQETGAANFFLIKDNTLITKPLDGSILPGITRDSLLHIGQSLGYTIEERPLTVTELLESAARSECALSGTAAVLTCVSELVYQGQAYTVGSGEVGEHTQRLRAALSKIQSGEDTALSDWLTVID